MHLFTHSTHVPNYQFSVTTNGFSGNYPVEASSIYYSSPMISSFIGMKYFGTNYIEFAQNIVSTTTLAISEHFEVEINFSAAINLKFLDTKLVDLYKAVIFILADGIAHVGIVVLVNMYLEIMRNPVYNGLTPTAFFSLSFNSFSTAKAWMIATVSSFDGTTFNSANGMIIDLTSDSAS